MDPITGATILIVGYLFVWLATPKDIKEELFLWLTKIPKLPFTQRKKVPMVKGVLRVRSKKTKVVRQYTNNSGVKFHVGDEVKLSEKALTTMDPFRHTFAGRPVTRGKIVSLFSDVTGLTIVEPKLGGFHTWHVDDLKKIQYQ